MKPHLFGVLTLGLAAAALGLLLFGGPDAPAVVVPAEQPVESGRLTVSGEGLVRVAPDMVWVVFGTASEGAFAEQAKAFHARKVKAIRAALMEAGVAEADIQPPRLRVAPNIQYVGNLKAEGHLMYGQIQVVVRDLGSLDAVLAAALDAGADEVQKITYGVTEPEPHRQAAVRAAMLHGKQRLSAAAGAVGISVTELVDAHVTVTDAMAEADLPTPNAALPGELWVRATASLTYRE